MRLLVIDGNSIINRAFYGIRLLTNSKGVYTNAILGFTNIYLKMLSDVEPDGVAVAWDLRAPTFRHKHYDGYKAQRKGMPEELAVQLPFMKELLGYLGVHCVECEGYEADDILGTLSKACCESGNECFVATGDRDSLQLVNDCVTVRLASTKEVIVYTPEKIMETYGVTPLQLIDVKALMGDSSDNIPGVKGIGEKTALSLIIEHGSLDKVYENLPNAKLTPSVRSKLEAGKDQAYMSRYLATIHLEVPVETDSKAYMLTKGDPAQARRLLTQLEMNATISKLKLPVMETVQSDEQKAEIDESVAVEIATVADKNIKPLESLDMLDNNIVDVMIDGDKLLINDGKALYRIEGGMVADFLESAIEKRAFEAKELHHFALKLEKRLENLVFAVDIGAYLLNPSSTDYSIRRLCSEYGVSIGDEESAELVSMPTLCQRLEAEIEKTEMKWLQDEVELPLAQVLADMELVGVKVNAKGVADFGEGLMQDIVRLEGEILALAGHEFNISSPKQLGEVLFNELGLPAKKKTKSGYSTNAEVLESIADMHEIIPLVLEYRKLTKLNSTYVEGLLKQISDDGRVHSVFKQTETRTGRISSTEPNMQNIPIRTELGRNMRRFFIAEKGRTFVDADYSQIELRVLAHISNDEAMISAFKHGEDFHTVTASQVFGLPIDLVSPEMRSAAKAVNFGIVYGIGAFSLSQDIGVSVAEADRYIKGYLNKYRGVQNYMERTVNDGKVQGYVETMFGRRRYIPELAASNKNLQAFGKRIAMNTPIQGSAADIIKIAMVRVYRRLREQNLDARLILQVHDELIVEASVKDAQKASVIVQEEMQSAAKLAVPLIAEVKMGKSWFDAH